MDEKRIYFCLKCKVWYSVHNKNTDPKCPDCGRALSLVNIDYEQFNALTDEERAELERRFISTHFSVPKTLSNNHEQYKVSKDQASLERNNNANKHKKDRDDFISTSDWWISLLETVCIIIILAFVMSGIYIMGLNFEESLYVPGILICAGLAFIGLFIVSSTMVFLGMARNLKAIKKELEEERQEKEKENSHE